MKSAWCNSSPIGATTIHRKQPNIEQIIPQFPVSMVTKQHGHSKVTIRVDQAKYVKQFRAGIENDVATAK